MKSFQTQPNRLDWWCSCGVPIKLYPFSCLIPSSGSFTPSRLPHAYPIAARHLAGLSPTFSHYIYIGPKPCLTFFISPQLFTLPLLTLEASQAQSYFVFPAFSSAFLLLPTKGMFLDLRLSFSLHSSMFVAKCLYDPCLFVSSLLFNCSPRYACTHPHLSI